MKEVDNCLQTEEPPVDSPTTRLPEFNPPYAEARQFKIPTKRKFPHLAARWAKRLALILLTLSGVASDSKPVLSQNIASNSPKTGENNLMVANIPPYQDTLQDYPERVETSTLTAEQVFENNKTTEAELRTKPDNIKDFKLVTNQQGTVEEIVVLAEDDKKTGTFVTRIRFNAQSGKYDKGFQTSRKPISIEAESVVKVDRMMMVAGQTEWASGIPVLLRSIDSVRPFESIDLSNINLSKVAEMNQIPNAPSKVMLVSGANSAILDTESLKTVQTLSKSGSGVVVTATPENNQTASLHSRTNNGLLKELINLITGQILDSQLFFRGVDIDGYDFKKDANNKPTHVLVTDNENQQDLVQDLSTNVVKATSYQALLDKIPVARKDMLLLRSVSIVNDWIWEAGQFSSGDGSGGVVVFARPFYTDPTVNSKDVAVYVIIKELSGMNGGGILQQGFKRGIFGGLPGHLLNIEGYGLVFIPSNQDGSPIAGATPTHIGIKDNPPPTVNIPVVLDALR